MRGSHYNIKVTRAALKALAKEPNFAISPVTLLRLASVLVPSLFYFDVDVACYLSNFRVFFFSVGFCLRVDNVVC